MNNSRCHFNNLIKSMKAIQGDSYLTKKISISRKPDPLTPGICN